MSKETYINNLVETWASKVPNGQPDPLNRNHVFILHNILEELDWSSEAILEFTSNLHSDFSVDILDEQTELEEKEIQEEIPEEIPEVEPDLDVSIYK